MSMEARVRRALSRLIDETCATHARLENLGGHASLRIYWRVHLPPGTDVGRADASLMAMVLPESARFESEEGGSSTDDAPQELPFLDVQRLLASHALRVPAVDRFDADLGVVLLEDLGDRTFERAYLEADSRAERLALYRRAIELLVEVQLALDAVKATERVSARSIAWGRRFDAELLRWELEHFWEWGMEAVLGAEAVASWRPSFERAAARLVDELLDAPQTLCLRDYQSRNIMLKTPDDWALIDFQDALLGPYVYDLVALLRDSYITLEPDDVGELVAYYGARAREAGLRWGADGDLERLVALQTLQRKLKDAGRFVYIDRVKGNPAFLDYFRPSIGYVQHALGMTGDYAELAEMLEATVVSATVTPQESS